MLQTNQFYHSDFSRFENTIHHFAILLFPAHRQPMPTIFILATIIGIM